MTDDSAASSAATHTIGEARKIPVGGVISRGFAVLFRNIVPFGFLALLLSSPLMIIGAASGSPTLVAVFTEFPLVSWLVSILISGLLSGALVYGTFMDLRGQPASLGACVGRGLALILPVLGVVFLSTIAMMIGMVLLIVPGIIVMIMLYVAIPVAVVERPGVFASLRRSRVLTKGNRWRLLGIIVIAQIVTQVPINLARVLTAPLNPIAGLSVDWIVSSLFGVFVSVIVAVTYYELRQAKEGASIEQLAAVFD